jgi:hypothetical protein
MSRHIVCDSLVTGICRSVDLWPHCEDPPAQQQQTHAPYPAYPAYPAYQQLSEARYHSGHGQTHGSSHNRASPASSSADPWRPPRFDVPDDGRSQGQQYYASHTDLQIPPASNDWRSSHSVYSPTSGFPQYQSPTSPTYPPGHNPSRAAVPTAHTHYQQPMAVSHPTLERNIQSRGATQLPYARAIPPVPSPVPYDIPAETPEPTIKKKRKRADARQLEALNRMYARTAFPSTEERLQLAKDLDMSARSVQIWLAHTFIYAICMISELSTIFSGSRTKDSRVVKADEILPTQGLQSARSLQLSIRRCSIFLYTPVPARPL